ncbi:MAG: 50S ribosomal protein L22 [Acidobacteriota bacterium]|nr:50S ribosomal protein L22 [Blastocatellia bacterium]MDW8412630.1 50S ribosomal protein L22 [Acidobacteriota bacterium]
MQAYARGKYVPGSAQKARLVIDLIRGRLVNEALTILKFTKKRAAKPIEKVLRAAIANAQQLAEKKNISVDVDNLYINKCYVDIGATKFRRRIRPAPMGRAYRERRHQCHITVYVSSKASGQEAKSSAAAESKRS